MPRSSGSESGSAEFTEPIAASGETLGGEQEGQTNKRRWVWRLAALGAIWFLGDFLYSCYVQYQIQEWEAAVTWTASGLAPDATPQIYEPAGEVDSSSSSVSTERLPPAFLLVHGFGDSPQIFRKLGPALAARGYQARSILLPGFGRTVDQYANSTKEQWLEHLRTELRELRAQNDEVWIIAHSLGGALTIHHQLQHPEMVDGLVLLAPAVEVSNQRSPLFPTRFWHEFSKYGLPFTTITCSPFDMDARDPEERQRAHRNIFSPRSVVDNTFKLIDQNRGRAKEIRVPVLTFVSTTDCIVDSDATEDFFASLASTKKKLIRLENSGHNVPVDYEWQVVVDEVDAFVRQHSSSVNTDPSR